jgi:hypothetical protein
MKVPDSADDRSARRGLMSTSREGENGGVVSFSLPLGLRSHAQHQCRWWWGEQVHPDGHLIEAEIRME